MLLDCTKSFKKNEYSLFEDAGGRWIYFVENPTSTEKDDGYVVFLIIDKVNKKLFHDKSQFPEEALALVSKSLRVKGEGK